MMAWLRKKEGVRKIDPKKDHDSEIQKNSQGA